MMQRVLVYVVLVVLLLASCGGRNVESQWTKVVALTYVPEHWDIGITDPNIYRPSSPSISAVLIPEQYIVVLDVDGTFVELRVSSEKFGTLNVGDSVLYTRNEGIIDE